MEVSQSFHADNLTDTTDDIIMSSLRDVTSKYTVILGALETWTLLGHLHSIAWKVRNS